MPYRQVGVRVPGETLSNRRRSREKPNSTGSCAMVASTASNQRALLPACVCRAITSGRRAA
jgi:hypothetical protein